LVFALGGIYDNYGLMLAGRFIFGLGGENMTAGQSALVSVWFKGKEMNFAFGTTMSIARIGATINGPIENWAADTHGVGYGMMLGFGVCIFSLVIACCLTYMDWWAEKKDNVKVEADPNDNF